MSDVFSLFEEEAANPQAFDKVGVKVERSEIRMPDGPIREIGESDISLHLHTDLDINVTVNVVSEE